jgi:hypothetical protein
VAKPETPKAPKTPAPRFGIGEWYGYSFVRLTPERRKQFSETARKPARNNPPCPFLADGTKQCTKPGGICSLRLYQGSADGSAVPVEGELGSLRVVCPNRFHQSGIVFSSVAEVMLNTSAPVVVPEVRFLRRDKTLPIGDASEDRSLADSEDVGNIDHVLVHPDTDLFRWCALEIQAVYFSGKKMGLLFEHIGSYAGPGIPFPDRVRRPDYRSSGPKRLMPQLQIKVPTLRRWGKKMAVVVDVTWFKTNVVGVETVRDISNCDIAWFLIDFDESTDPATLKVGDPDLQTLERAVEGLTGGYPVTLSEFEAKIRDKLAPKKPKKPKKGSSGSAGSAPSPSSGQ